MKHNAAHLYLFSYYRTYDSLCSFDRNGGWDFAITFSSVYCSVSTVDNVFYNVGLLHLNMHMPTDDSRRCVSITLEQAVLFILPSEVNAKLYGMSGWYWKFDGNKS